MNIACPKCDTTFSLPDELYRPGKKARCSQCGNVFAMPDLASPSDGPAEERPRREDPAPGVGDVAPSLPPPPPLIQREKKKFPVLLVSVLAACCLLLGLGGFLLYRSLNAPAADDAATTRLTDEQKRLKEDVAVLAKDIEVDGIRQFVDSNDAIGGIVVIMGEAVNTADPPKELITLEARLLDKNRKVLASQMQICGVTLPTYQLKTLSAKQLREGLDNRATILLNNTNVGKGQSVPFMIIFTKVPPAMELFSLDVVDVRRAPPPTSQEAAPPAR